MLDTERLINLRKQHDMTQEDVAEKLNTSRPNYVRYERGNHQPPNDTLILIADVFNVSTDYLLGKTDNPDPSAKEKAPINDRDLKIAFFGNPDEDDALLEDVRSYAKFVKERKQSQVKKDENAK